MFEVGSADTAEGDSLQAGEDIPARSRPSALVSPPAKSSKWLVAITLLIAVCVGTGALVRVKQQQRQNSPTDSTAVGAVITCVTDMRQSFTCDEMLVREQANTTFTTTLIVLGNSQGRTEYAVVFGKLTVEEGSLDAEDDFPAGNADSVPIAMVQVNSTNGEIVEIEVTQAVESLALENGLRLVRQAALKPDAYAQIYANEQNTECRHPVLFAKQRFCPTVSRSVADLRNVYRSHYSYDSVPESKESPGPTELNITEEVVINKDSGDIEMSLTTASFARLYHWNAVNSSVFRTETTFSTEFQVGRIGHDLIMDLRTLFSQGNYSTERIRTRESGNRVQRNLATIGKKVKIFTVYGEMVSFLTNLQVATPARMDTSIIFAGKTVFLTSETFGENVRIYIGKLAALKKAVNASSFDMLTAISDFGDYLDANLPARINAKVDDIQRTEKQLKNKAVPPEASVLNLISTLASNLQTLKNTKLTDLNSAASSLNSQITSLKLQNKPTADKEAELSVIQNQINQINAGTYSFDGMGYDNVDYVLDPLKNQITDIKKDFSDIASIASSLSDGISQEFATFASKYRAYASTMKSNFLSISNFQPLPCNEISTNVFSYTFFDKQTKSIKSDLNAFSESVPAFTNVNSTVTQLNTAIKSDIQETVWTSAFDNIKSRLKQVLEPYHINSVTLSTIDSMKSDFVASLGQPMEPLVKCLSSECAKPVSSESLSDAHSNLQDAFDMKNTKVNDFLQQYMKKTEPTTSVHKTENFTISDIDTPLHPTSIYIEGIFTASQSTEVAFATDRSFTDTLKTIVNFSLGGSYFEEDQENHLLRVKLFTGMDCTLEFSSCLKYFSIISKITGKEAVTMQYTGNSNVKVSRYTLVRFELRCWNPRRKIVYCDYFPVYEWSEFKDYSRWPAVGLEKVLLAWFTP